VRSAMGEAALPLRTANLVPEPIRPVHMSDDVHLLGRVRDGLRRLDTRTDSTAFVVGQAAKDPPDAHECLTGSGKMVVRCCRPSVSLGTPLNHPANTRKLPSVEMSTYGVQRCLAGVMLSADRSGREVEIVIPRLAPVADILGALDDLKEYTEFLDHYPTDDSARSPVALVFRRGPRREPAEDPKIQRLGATLTIPRGASRESLCLALVELDESAVLLHHLAIGKPR
jgi:hypothetical protein